MYKLRSDYIMFEFPISLHCIGNIYHGVLRPYHFDIIFLQWVYKVREHIFYQTRTHIQFTVNEYSEQSELIVYLQGNTICILL